MLRDLDGSHLAGGADGREHDHVGFAIGGGGLGWIFGLDGVNRLRRREHVGLHQLWRRRLGACRRRRGADRARRQPRDQRPRNVPTRATRMRAAGSQDIRRHIGRRQSTTRFQTRSFGGRARRSRRLGSRRARRRERSSAPREQTQRRTRQSRVHRAVIGLRCLGERRGVLGREQDERDRARDIVANRVSDGSVSVDVGGIERRRRAEHRAVAPHRRDQAVLVSVLIRRRAGAHCDVGFLARRRARSARLLTAELDQLAVLGARHVANEHQVREAR